MNVSDFACEQFLSSLKLLTSDERLLKFNLGDLVIYQDTVATINSSIRFHAVSNVLEIDIKDLATDKILTVHPQSIAAISALEALAELG